MIMGAAVQLATGRGEPVRGEYGLYWVSTSQWREEIKLGTYYRIRVGNEQGYWQASNLEYQPEVIFDLDRLLSLKGALTIGQSESLSKVGVRRGSASSEYCSEVKGKFGRIRTLCFRNPTGELSSVDYPATEPGNPSEISRVEYSSFKTMEGKSIPLEVEGFHGRKPELVLTITKIEAMPEHDTGLFERPPNSEFWETCDEVTEPKLTHMVFLDSPRPVEFTKSVTLYLVVETDGLPSHITVIQGRDSVLDAAAVSAARKWRYKPAMCGNAPVRKEIETALTVGP